MIKSLLFVLVLFSGVVGYGLAGNHVNAWTVGIFCLASVAALEFGWFASIIIAMALEKQ